jgi:uracil phosphoribosyltransferase
MVEEISFFKKISDLNVYKINSEHFVENSFIVSHPSFSSVLYSPYCAGINLQNKMLKVGYTFAKSIKHLCLKGQTKKSSICELVLLSGGLFYNLNFGFKKLFNFSLQQCFLGISRYPIENKFGEFYAKIDYSNFEALPDNSTILIGDTLATGATLSKALEHLFEVANKNNKKISSIIFVTLAGSKKGAAAFKKTIENYKISNSYMIFANQVFHLMPDGTDLRFFGADAIVPKSTFRETLKNYGEFLGFNFKCAVFDWGTRCKNPISHYNEFEEYITNFLPSIPKEDKKSKKVLLSLLKKVQKEKLFYDGTI